MKGTPMPSVLPVKLSSFLSTALTGVPANSKKIDKKRKKSKKKKKIPKGFAQYGEQPELYLNRANGWYFHNVTKLYFKHKAGPFFVFDAKLKKLVPKV
jgi:hypothetical protein